MTRQKVAQSFERVREITFLPLTTSSVTEGPLVIEAEIGGNMIHRMYVDEGFSMEILYEHCFNRLRPKVRNQMVPTTTSLTGFSGETIWPLGQLRLLVTIGDVDHSTRSWMNFMIVRSLSSYNGIIERLRIKEIQAAPSTAHGMLKFPVDGGIVTIRSTVLIPAECATVITSSAVPKEVGARPENFKVALHPNFPDQEVAIRGTLSVKGRTKLCSLLKENLDIFAWQPSDMIGVPWLVAEHQLNIREGYSPVRQKKRGQVPERTKAIQEEVQKLVEAGIMREVYYHDWFSNPIMDCYPLPEIDWKVESLCGYLFKSFLDAYKGYHQIQLAELDEEKKAFHTDQGVYCYTKMPFGLKNAGATYQRLVDKAFHNQIEKYLSLFKTLKKCIKKSDFHWTSEAEQDFKQLKQHLSELPLLVAPKPKEELIVYMFASYGAISAVLMTERGAVQMPVYFVSHALQGSELNYTPMKKLVMSLVFASKRLRRRKLSSRISGRNSTRAVDTLHGWVVMSSNNEAEYEALIAGLRIAARMGVKNVHLSVDSKLVANQVLGTYVAKEENMIKYLEKVKSLVNGFTNFSISQVPRSKNKKADALSKITSTSFAHLSKQVLVEILKEKSIKEKEVTTVVEEDGPTWMTPIMEYLKEGTLPSDRKEARKLCIKARQYELLEGGPLQAVIPCPVVKVRRTTPSRSNGLVERANRSLREGIKAHLGERNKNWVEEVPHVLWAYRTMIKSSHGDTPFSLTYGTEAVIPAEIGMPTYRTAAVNVVYNDDELRLNLDLLEERRERAAIREAKAKLKMIKYYNARVRGVTFRQGDFVYRSMMPVMLWMEGS
nr:reverse transcriptase domain-containing protein [Tanacetum cinerariifolium]